MSQESRNGKTSVCIETISRIDQLNGQSQLDEMRKILYSPGFFALLKTKAPGKIAVLRRFFSVQEGRQNHGIAKERDAGGTASCAGTFSDVMPVVGPLMAPLRRYALSLTKDRTAADDLIQDCLENVIRGWHQRRADGNTRAWIFTIMRNLALTGFQKQSRRGSHASIEDSNESDFSAQPLQDDGLLHRDLINGMRNLSEEHRHVLLLISLEDLSYTEAADLLDVPVGTVRSRLARAREKLVASLNGTETSRPTIRGLVAATSHS